MTIALYRRDRSPYWWMRVAQLDSNGRVIGYDRVSTKRTDKAEAKLVASAHAQREHNRAQLGHRDAATIGEAAQRYLDELSASGKDVRTVGGYLTKIEYSKSRMRKDAPIELLNRTELASVKAEMLSAGYSPKTVNNVITFWVTVYNKANQDYGMAVAPAQNFKGLKLETKEKTRYLLPGEEAKLLAELNPERNTRVGAHVRQALQDQYDLTVFLLDTGARYGEVAEVPWTAIDVINWKTINIYREKVGNEGTLIMTDRLREILKRRYDTCGHLPYVFPARYDEHEARGYSTKGIRAAIDRAGLNTDALVKRYGKFTPHSLRHTFASRLVQNGVSLYAVSKLLGHSNTTMTERYAFLAPSHVAEQAADILNAIKE